MLKVGTDELMMIALFGAAAPGEISGGLNIGHSTLPQTHVTALVGHLYLRSKQQSLSTSPSGPVEFKLNSTTS